MSAETTFDEVDLHDACEMVADITASRMRGLRNSLAGTSDEDLLSAIEDAHDKITEAMRCLRGY